MEEATKRVLEGLEKAIRAEVEGYHFYKMAAQSTEDEKGREVFSQLAEDEVKHARFLQVQHDSLSKTGKVDLTVKLGEATKFEGEHPIFSKNIVTRIKTAHYEMTAISVGAQLELTAVKFYRAEADAAADPEVAAFFRELADWESGHYHALLAQQEALKDEYWVDGGFSPF